MTMQQRQWYANRWGGRWSRFALAVVSLVGAVYAAPKPSEYAGSKTCVTCHAREFDSWRRTPMANASGPAEAAVIPGSFFHSTSGTDFEFKKSTANPVIAFRKHSPSGEEITGSIALEYFVGSGRRGRTFLFQREGWWFEAPVNWYAKKHVWDMPPGLQSVREIPLTLPVDGGCLQCHATNVTAASIESRNKFGAVPFAEGGIGCEACHGPAAEHVRARGKSPMMQIAKLAAPERDSICMQCHLEAEIQVDRDGHKKTDFRPGEDLLQLTDFFFHPERKKLRAVSQFESLWESKCKVASGTKMTCTTCHEPHTTVASAERIGYYREKCLTCHGELFGHKHKNADPNCIGCHMPTREADVPHEEATDHRILRTPDSFKTATGNGLLHFPDGSRAASRELGLASTQAASRSKDPTELDCARTELEHAVHAGASDAKTWAAIGFIAGLEGQKSRALEAYESAIERGSNDPAVLNDAAVFEVNNGKTRTAITLWQRGFNANPWQSELGMNLAQLYCAIGDNESAKKTLQRVLEFNPDNERALTLRSRLRECGKREGD